MQENANIDLLLDVLADSIDLIEDSYTRSRLKKSICGLKNGQTRDLELEVAIDFSYEVKTNRERYDFDLITEQEFIQNIRNIIGRVEYDRVCDATENISLKRRN